MRLEREDGVATVTLARPANRNAQTPATWRALAAAGRELLADGATRVVVLRAEGPSFSAGLDRAMFTTGVDGEPGLAGLATLDDEALDVTIAGFQEAFTWWRDERVLTVAAVQGHAVGAGFQLALACDLRVLADDARLAMREPSLGLVPDLGGTKPLADAVGYSRALEICATGRWVTRRRRPTSGWPRSWCRAPSSTPRPGPRGGPARRAGGGGARHEGAAARCWRCGRTSSSRRPSGSRRPAGCATWRETALLTVDLSLSDDHAAVRAAVREWVDAVVVPDALRNDREERFPQEALDGLRQTGFVGMTIPEEHGGGGADPLAYVLFIEELGRGDANVRSIMSVHLGLVAGSVARWGTAEQQREWLPRMATGEVLGCFGLTEPDHGSDPAGLRATAERLPGGGLAAERAQGVHHQRHHRRARPGDGALGRAGRAGRVGVPRPDRPARVLRRARARQARPAVVRHGRAGARRGRGRARGAARGRGRGAQGRALGARRRPDVHRRVVHRHRAGRPGHDGGLRREREQFGKPIAGHQLVQELLADSAVDVDASRLLTWAVADRKARGETYSLAASKAKLFATEASVRVANACIQVHGGYGYVDEYPAAKYLRDARVTTLYEGTSQVQKLLIGRALTGVSAF